MRVELYISVYIGRWTAELFFVDAHGEIHQKFIEGESDGKTKKKALELMAIIAGMKSLVKPVELKVITNNDHIYTCINNAWYKNWEKTSGINSRGFEIEYWELWKQIIKLMHENKIVLMAGKK